MNTAVGLSMQPRLVYIYYIWKVDEQYLFSVSKVKVSSKYEVARESATLCIALVQYKNYL